MIITSPENSNDFLVSSIHDRFHSSDHTFLYRMRLFPQRLCSGCVYFCGGTSPVRQKYSQTQTYIKQINSEISAKVGIEIPLPIWIKIVAELQAKYGFEQGEIDSRTVEYEMGAEPRSKVVYVVTWKEIWDSGTAKLTTDQQGFSVPFRVRTNLVFQIDSQKIACP